MVQQSTERRSIWWGVLVAVAGWALLIYPMFWALLFASWGFSGCFLTCTQPDPALGALAVAVLALMIATPLMAAVALVRRSRAWWLATVCAGVAVVIPLLYGVSAGSF